MGKLKVMTIVGTRPELIRLSEIIKKAEGSLISILMLSARIWERRWVISLPGLMR